MKQTSTNMLRSFTLLLSFLCINHIGLTQQSKFFYSVDGNVNIDNGKVSLIPVGDTSYYPVKTDFPKVEIIKGKFSIKGYVSYPYAFILEIDKESKRIYLSDIFWIEPGYQTITCNVDSIRKTPLISNKQMKEFKDEYIPALRKSEATNNDDLFFVSYVKAHPDSYVALWKIIRAHSSVGYLPECDSAFHYFSATIKNSYAGRVLSKKLSTASITAIGNYFPHLQLRDLKNKKAVLLNSSNNNRYILLDFWFSHCVVCIEGFPKMKELYAAYHKKGFEIIGISVDGDSKIADWKKVIEENKLNWIHYLDKDGNLTHPLAIAGYPTLLLLDGSGKIIANHISLKDLKLFLEEHLQ